MKTLQEALDWLYGTQDFGIKLGLENVTALLKSIGGIPEQGVLIAHIAGSNGKGSTCAFLEAIARKAGHKTGLFTSPHLVDYAERMRVNGVNIPHDVLFELLCFIKGHVEGWDNHPSFFEITLAIAMVFFIKEKCTCILLETGMGGRLDATTALIADVAVITPIARDHMQWLGEDLGSIALEKAGIMVAGKPVVSARQVPEVSRVIQQHAEALGCQMDWVERPLGHMPLGLLGAHQKENAALAVLAAQHMGIQLSENALKETLGAVRWPGRFERCDRTGLILDAAHNPHSAEALVATWKEVFGSQKAVILFSGLRGKQVEKTLEILASIAAHFHFIAVHSPRALTLCQLQEALHGAPIPFTSHGNLQEALEGSPRPSLVCGSIFLLGELKALLAKRSIRETSQ